MTLFDGLVALGVIFAIFIVVYSKFSKKNPEAHEKLKKYFPSSKSDKIIPKPFERVEQLYEERRSMM